MMMRGGINPYSSIGSGSGGGGGGSESWALQFRDLQATTLSLDHTGSWALLAGRKYLAILKLDELGEEVDPSAGTTHHQDRGGGSDGGLVVRLPYGGKYDISNTQWSKAEEKRIAVASSQRCDIFELRDGSELKCTLRLKGHTRVITDLDWSTLQPTLLASSSFDSYVHIWDIRTSDGSTPSDKPQFSLSALDGASQVRWNRCREDILASCDGGHVKIWDLRKPNAPSEFIAAHASKINGLEWANSDTVITAAQDCTVKFSKLSDPENPNKVKGPILSLTAPVWRARPAPFGRGCVTQCVPILRRDSGLLSLWDWKQRFASPIFTFQAYDIIEFAWRRRNPHPSSASSTPSTSSSHLHNGNNNNFDLITWSRDQTLRIWTLPREIVALCGGDDDGDLDIEGEEFYGEGRTSTTRTLSRRKRSRNQNSSSNPNTSVSEEGGADYVSEGGDEGGVESLTEEEEEEEESPPPPSSSTDAGGTTPTPTTLRNKRMSSTATLERRSRKSSSPSPLHRRDFLKAEFERVETEKPEHINFDQIELEKGLLRFSWSSVSSAKGAELYSSSIGSSKGGGGGVGGGRGGGITAGILASFPSSYPSAPPTFLVTNASSEVDKNHVVKLLKNLAQQYSKKGEQCLGKCVEQFSAIMDKIKTLEDVEQGYFPNVRGVSNVPFPRTSGARFCAVGMLVCFGRPSYLKRVKSNCDAGTPRALSALGPYLSQVALENDDNRHRSSHHHRSRPSRHHETKKRAGLVTLFDVSPLLPFNLTLAEGYTHIVGGPGQRRAAFDINQAVAAAVKKVHVANVWAAAGIIASFAHPKRRRMEEGEEQEEGRRIYSSSRQNSMEEEEEEEEELQVANLHDMTTDEEEEEESLNWLAYHPLGCELIHSMITHSAQYGDVQTAATLAGLFTSREHLPAPPPPGGLSGAELVQFKKQQAAAGAGHRQTVPRLTVPKWWTKGVGSPYHTVHGSDTHHATGHAGLLINPHNTEAFFRQHRSNSWSDSLDDIKALQLLHSAGVSQELLMGGGGDGSSYHSSSSGMQIQSGSHTHHGVSGGRGGHGHNSHHLGGSGLLLESSIPSSVLTLYPGGGGGNGNRMMRSIMTTNVVCIAKPLIPIHRGVLLDSSLHSFYDRYKKSYAEILFRWGLLQQRAEILKNLTETSESNTITRMGVDFNILCRNCGQSSKSPYCANCKRIVSICSICHTPGRGLCTFCPICGHGGHADHIQAWFARGRVVCPSGCGCHCLREPPTRPQVQSRAAELTC